jgi:hypothetical protein
MEGGSEAGGATVGRRKGVQVEVENGREWRNSNPAMA